MEAVLEAFAAERLLILAAGTVEISHEVLLTAWPLLRDTWLAETHADRHRPHPAGQRRRRLGPPHRDPSYLYSGSLLETAAETAARIGADPARHPPLIQTEHDFLQASDRARHRRVRRRQGLIAFLAAWSSASASAAGLALLAQQNAVHQRDIAVSDKLASRSGPWAKRILSSPSC